MKVSIKVWGDFALFTRSDSKIDRVSYPVPTPSACRGILEAIYCKPIEFWYEITKISILKPITYIDIMKNEVSKKGSYRKNTVEPIDVNKNRTQRHNWYLRDVAYIIEADIHVRDTYLPNIPMYKKEKDIKSEFLRRVTKGKQFTQPYLGTSECMCFYELPDRTEKPLKELDDINLGIVLYDIFDPQNITPLNTEKGKYHNSVKVSYYRPKIINGTINVPRYNSDEVFK